MSGRMQAAIVAVLFGLLPMLWVISVAVVALVTLRRGWQDGLQTLLWALLPALLQWKLGDSSVVFALAGVMPAALLLRNSRSWQAVILLLLAAGIAVQWTLPWHGAALIKMLQTAADKLQRDGLQLQLLVDGKLVNATSAQLVDAWLQFYGAYQMVVMFGCLAVARYWQATLYNPGGFRQEFHQLRLDPRLMAAILVLMALAVQDITPVNDWLFMLCLLPFVQGMAVVHYAVAARNASYWVSQRVALLFRSELNQPQEKREDVEVTFFPQGGSTGGVLEFALKDYTAKVRIDPITGRITTAWRGDELKEEPADAKK